MISFRFLFLIDSLFLFETKTTGKKKDIGISLFPPQK